MDFNPPIASVGGMRFVDWAIKTNQTGLPRSVIVVGSSFAASAVRNYINIKDSLDHTLSPTDPLFQFITAKGLSGRRISKNYIYRVVKLVATFNGLKGKFASHSLRSTALQNRRFYFQNYRH